MPYKSSEFVRVISGIFTVASVFDLTGQRRHSTLCQPKRIDGCIVNAAGQRAGVPPGHMKKRPRR